MPYNFQRDMHIPSYTHPSLLENTTTFGKELIASKNIQKGTILAIFQGLRITTEEAKQITRTEKEDSHYIMQIDDNVWLLPLKREKADYFNHSCEPNTGFDNRRAQADTLIAIRDILPGESISYHYAFTDADDEYFSFTCECGATTCVGNFFIELFQNDIEFQNKYWDYLAPYLRDRIEEKRFNRKADYLGLQMFNKKF